MDKIVPGQRWISNTESELGLGLILDVDFNRITVLFLATGERRVYAKDNAPLTRVEFSQGDTIESSDGLKLTIQSVSEEQGVLTYQGVDAQGNSHELVEMELDHHIQFNKPQDRLFTGQFDPASWFRLRYDTWQRQQRFQQSEVKGLQGARVSLIPHQIYIAHEAAGRMQPRVMLADEVGLGKTIEAGLITHYRLLNGLSRRVLIIVPDSLMHQWLVEMLRRFNLQFSLFDEERCLETHEATPFLSEQLIICAQGFFSKHPNRMEQALAAEWDLLIVDEAHHLEWDEDNVSLEYQFVEQLAAITPGVILLTATPEQMGAKSHFARLRLLDPDRFFSFEKFLQEQKQFEPVAEIVHNLLKQQPLSPEELSQLKAVVKHDQADALLAHVNDEDKSELVRAELIRLLLDQHGTGRILFRNSRQTVKGFPDRQCHGYLIKNDSNEDAYLQWLLDKLTALAGDKALLICKKPETVIRLEKILRTRYGIASAVFHEGMSIIERDRAAAYFADEESCAQLLICSEIGSEGRNFQFVHHLILFDLPDNPDLLQQRIGRLDRIGQKQVIQIHVPYVENTQQHVLYRWYEEGLDVFRHNFSGAAQVANRVSSLLQTALQSLSDSDVQQLIDETRLQYQQVEEELHKGRDPLLELNSCRPEIAAGLIEKLRQRDQDDSLWSYLENLFDCYGVDVEYHSRQCHILRPSENLRISHFPLLQDDGVTVTVDRDIALAREDMQFLTEEHPMMTAAMDMVLSSETGNATVRVIQHPDLQAGRFMLELLFIVECSAPPELQIGRFLPPTPIRILLDQQQKDLSEEISHASMQETEQRFDKHQISRFLQSQRDFIVELIKIAEQKAQSSMQEILIQAEQTMHRSYEQEIKRLHSLQKVNVAIKPEEIEQLQQMAQLSAENIQAARLKLDAVSFVIVS